MSGDIVAWSVLGAAVAFYFALGALRWALGQRREALHDIEKGVTSIVLLLLVLLILHVANEVARFLGVAIDVANPASVQSALRYASSVFWNASRVAVDAILYVSTERAVLAATPLTAPLSSVLGAATGWSTTELSIVAIYFMHLSFAADVISRVATWLLSLGVTLTPIPALRKAGASLLAAYVSASLSLPYAAVITQEALAKARVPSALNPADWFQVAGIVGETAVALGSAAAEASVAIALGAVAGIGLASIFGSMYLNLVHL